MSMVEPNDGGRLPAGQRDREARLLGALNDLLARRPDLRGVHAPADSASDAVRWSV